MLNFQDCCSELLHRQLVYQYTGKSLQDLLSQVKVMYIGLDATAPSIHAGYLIPIILTSILQRYGIQTIILLGGGTTKIGDPTGKNTARQMLTQTQIDQNSAGLTKAIHKFFPHATLVNNDTWLSKIGFIEYLTKIAPFVSVNSLINNEIFSTRLENHNPLSLMELNYPILQGYDYVHLNKEYDCNLQIGGSDQWNNILMGVDLVHKMNQNTVYGLTCPLLLTANGRKMGKSEKGTVWLDSTLYAPFDFWQYWRNIDDADCLKYIKLLINPTEAEMDSLINGNINDCKKFLANNITSLVHGPQAALIAKEQAESIFEQKTHDKMDILNINEPTNILDILITLQYTTSRSEGKKLIAQNGITINGSIINDPLLIISTPENIIAKGKKHMTKIILH